jgi:hypothetical protein
MNRVVFVLLVMASVNANADVFKCKSVATGEMDYQLSPCATLHQAEAVKLMSAKERQALASQQLAGEIEHQNRVNSYNTLYVPQHRYGDSNQKGFGGR